MQFVFEYSDHWNYSCQLKLNEFFAKGLKADRTETVLSIILSHLNTAEKIVPIVFDELIECAQQTPHNSVRGQIREVLLNNKNGLSWSQKDKAREVYADADLD